MKQIILATLVTMTVASGAQAKINTDFLKVIGSAFTVAGEGIKCGLLGQGSKKMCKNTDKALQNLKDNNKKLKEYYNNQDEQKYGAGASGNPLLGT